MLAKLTSKNQLTLPKAVLSFCKGTEYFEVTAKLAELGIGEHDVADAVDWARAGSRDGGKQGG